MSSLSWLASAHSSPYCLACARAPCASPITGSPARGSEQADRRDVSHANDSAGSARASKMSSMGARTRGADRRGGAPDNRVRHGHGEPWCGRNLMGDPNGDAAVCIVWRRPAANSGTTASRSTSNAGLTAAPVRRTNRPSIRPHLRSPRRAGRAAARQGLWSQNDPLEGARPWCWSSGPQDLLRCGSAAAIRIEVPRA